MKPSRKLLAALAALAGQEFPGANAARLETMIDLETNNVLIELAEVLARNGGNPRVKRSAAARHLLRKGAEAMLAEATVQA